MVGERVTMFFLFLASNEAPIVDSACSTPLVPLFCDTSSPELNIENNCARQLITFPYFMIARWALLLQLLSFHTTIDPSLFDKGVFTIRWTPHVQSLICQNVKSESSWYEANLNNAAEVDSNV
jgi:hypothetical protein